MDAGWDSTCEALINYQMCERSLSVFSKHWSFLSDKKILVCTTDIFFFSFFKNTAKSIFFWGGGGVGGWGGEYLYRKKLS